MSSQRLRTIDASDVKFAHRSKISHLFSMDAKFSSGIMLEDQINPSEKEREKYSGYLNSLRQCVLCVQEERLLLATLRHSLYRGWEEGGTDTGWVLQLAPRKEKKIPEVPFIMRIYLCGCTEWWLFYNGEVHLPCHSDIRVCSITVQKHSDLWFNSSINVKWKGKKINVLETVVQHDRVSYNVPSFHKWIPVIMKLWLTPSGWLREQQVCGNSLWNQVTWHYISSKSYGPVTWQLCCFFSSGFSKQMQ